MTTVPKSNEMRQRAIEALDSMYNEEMEAIAREMRATNPTDCCLHHTLIHPQVMDNAAGTLKSYGYGVRRLRKFLGRQDNNGTEQVNWVLEIKWW